MNFCNHKFLILLFILFASCDFTDANKGKTIDLFGLESVRQSTQGNPKDNSNSYRDIIDDVHGYLLNSTVIINVYDENGDGQGQGSGFFIEDGYLVTNYHVIENAHSITIGMHGMDIIARAKVKHYDEENDLALLSSDFKSDFRLKVAPAVIKAGDAIIVAGSPKGLEGTLSTGIVSALREYENFGQDLVQISAAISPGSSGGPVVNHSGELVGIACSGIESGNDLYFAVPVKYLINLLDR